MKNIKKILSFALILTGYAHAGSQYNPYGYNMQQAAQNTARTAYDVGNFAQAPTIANGAQLYNQVKIDANTKMGKQAIKAAESPEARKAALAAAGALI
jgi:hypothetical protein